MAGEEGDRASLDGQPGAAVPTLKIAGYRRMGLAAGSYMGCRKENKRLPGQGSLDMAFVGCLSSSYFFRQF
jgi:hypothetical protein